MKIEDETQPPFFAPLNLDSNRTSAGGLSCAVVAVWPTPWGRVLLGFYRKIAHRLRRSQDRQVNIIECDRIKIQYVHYVPVALFRLRLLGPILSSNLPTNYWYQFK